MRGGIRWVTVAAPVAVVVGLGEIHAHLVGHYPFTGTTRFAWTLAYIALLELAAYAAGLPDAARSAAGAAWTAGAAACGGAVGISLAQLSVASALLPRAVVFGSALVLFPAYSALALAGRRARYGAGADRVVAVVDPGERAALEDDLDRAAERPARIVATVECTEADQLAAAARAARAGVVVLGRHAQLDEAVVAAAAELHAAGMRVRTLTLFYDEWLGKLPTADLERMSLMFDIQEIHGRRYARLKRLVDVLAALVGVVLLVPATVVVWCADRAGNPGPLFYRQPRVGKGGRTFVMVKFRTMTGREGTGMWTAEDDPRVPRVGRALRRIHLDELPQVLNILAGDLSLIGPRPEQPHYVEELRRKIPFYDIRHLVTPGITGWAQVNYTYGSSVADAIEKLQYEFYYLRHQGPLLDGRILARTVRTVLRLGGR